MTTCISSLLLSVFTQLCFRGLVEMALWENQEYLFKALVHLSAGAASAIAGLLITFRACLLGRGLKQNQSTAIRQHTFLLFHMIF